MPIMQNQLRMAYIAGPANAPALYGEWTAGSQTSFFGTDYMKEYFRLACDLDADSYVVTWSCGEQGTKRCNSFIFDNRPIRRYSGPLYHLTNIAWFVRLMPALIRFRPHVLILTGNYNYWWVLAPLRWMGIAFIPSYHGVLWRRFGPVRATWRALVRLNRRFILDHAEVVVTASGAISIQVQKLFSQGERSPKIITHLPTYSPAQFASIGPPEAFPRRPFRVMFLGRIVADKGIYDILEVARRLHIERKGEFLFDLCGSGVDLEAFRRRVEELGLEKVVTCHGYCGPEAIRQLFGASHACIVPTRSEIEVGFEMTCAEAILAGRPLITSAVCPALEYVRDAAVEVEPDNVDQYHAAIVNLSEDEELYEAKLEACAILQQQFYDPRNSWYAAMRESISLHLANRAPT